MSSAAAECFECAERAGLFLDPWQKLVLDGALGERDDGQWQAFQVGLCVPRQNGKGSILEARELAGLFAWGDRLIIHSAHQFDTSLEAFRRLLMLVESAPEFEQRVKRISRSHGEEGIELKGGQRIRFRTRTGGGGRGFTGDTLILDEAMYLPESFHSNLLPTLSARPNPQVWYTGSAVDQEIHSDGTVFARLRERGHAGGLDRLAYFEWSLDYESPDDIPESELESVESWAQANPGLGIRITEEWIRESELAGMTARGFAVEREGVGDWPDAEALTPIPLERWKALTDTRSRIVGQAAYAVDVSPDRAWASIARAGRRTDGKAHVEIMKRDRGTGWILAALKTEHASGRMTALVCDGAGPVKSLLPELEEELPLEPVTAGEYGAACGRIFDAVDQETARHLGTAELEAAVRGAAVRPLGDAWAWSRKSSATDITPLVAVTLAHWGLETFPPKPVYRARGFA